MRRFRSWRVLAGLITQAASCLLAAPVPEKLLPPDTLAFVTAPSWEAALGAINSSTYGRLWADPAMGAFRDHFQTHLKAEVVGPIENELGLSVSNWTGLFQGQITLALTATAPDSQPGRNAGFVLLADAGKQSGRLATNLAVWRKHWAEAGKPLKSLRIRDTECHLLVFPIEPLSQALDRLLPNPEPGKAAAGTEPKPVMAEWTVAQAGSFLVVSDSGREIDRTLSLLATNGTALADDKSFAADRAMVSGARVYGWANIQATVERVAQPVVPPAADAQGSAGGSFSMGRLLQALGFGTVQSASFAVRESGSGLSAMLRVKAPAGSRKGVFKTLEFEAKDSMPPAFVPADAVKFSRARLDLPKVWGNLEATLGEASPPAASFLKFIINTAGKAEDENYDLRERLIKRLGDDLITYEKVRQPKDGTETTSSIFLVGARNPEQVASSIKALANLIPPNIARYRERESLGRTIYSVTLPRSQDDGTLGAGDTWCYAPGGAYVAFSSDASLLEEYLRTISGVAQPLSEQAGLKSAAREVEVSKAGYFSYENTRETTRAAFGAAQKDVLSSGALSGAMKLGSRLGLSQEGGVPSWFDWSLLPRFEKVERYLHWNVSSLVLDAEGYTYRLVAPNPPAAK